MSLSLVDVSNAILSLARLRLAFLAIAGLSMAIGLAMSGHTVRVLEKSPSLGNSPGGIRLSPNVTKILVQWGLEDELRKRGSFVQGGTRMWDCKSFDRLQLLRFTLFRATFLTPVMSLTAGRSLVETGKLVGHMEWEERILQESGAKFYMLRVCPILGIGMIYPFIMTTVQ